MIDEFKRKISDLKNNALNFLDEMKEIQNKIIDDYKKKIMESSDQIELILKTDLNDFNENSQKTKDIENKVDSLIKELTGMFN